MLAAMRIYSLYFVQFLKARLSYRADFFSGIVANVLSAVAGVLFVVVLIDGKAVPNLGGWSRSEVLFIYAYSLIATSLFGIVSPNLYRFGEKYIIEGQFDRVLLRPLNSLLQILCEAFNLEGLGNIVLGIFILLYTAHRINLPLGILDVAWLVLSIASGALILIAVFVIVTSLSFHFEDRFGLVPPIYNLVLFSRYPLPVFNRLIQVILSWVIPFGFVAFYPATHFFSRSGYELLCYLTPLVALVCVMISALCWRAGVAKYASTGS